MANRWNNPIEVENFVKLRDSKCVYCKADFSQIHKSRKTKPTWEHLVNDIKLNSINNIALCCTSCNASKGARNLENWLKSKFCVSKGITRDTVAPVVKPVLDDGLKSL